MSYVGGVALPMNSRILAWAGVLANRSSRGDKPSPELRRQKRPVGNNTLRVQAVKKQVTTKNYRQRGGLHSNKGRQIFGAASIALESVRAIG
ncbi:MAG: hypothetical protein IPO43_22390 [Rhodoferax sp.]|nr:hypothetical protein [Rhodoferax sp.]